MMTAAVAAPPRMGIQAFREVGKRGQYAKHSEDYISRFYKLVRRWRAETAYVSSVSELFNNAAFVEIVGMGTQVVPLIIGELRQQPDLLVGALTRITGENPVPMSDRGDIYAMATAWIGWFQRRAQ